MLTGLDKAAPSALSDTGSIPDKMSGSYFGFVLLVWLPARLHAQTAACQAPKLAEGYFVPAQDAYPHNSMITYACDEGHKPAVGSWWATSTCQNGSWLHPPQCIDKTACLPPMIPNGKYTESSDGWFSNQKVIRITCDKGYEHKNYAATAKCLNGTWSSLPACERSTDACDEPPKVPHAVIVGQEYQELFAGDSKVEYECERGYTIEGASSTKSVICISGIWSRAPVCSRQTGTGQGQGGSGSTVGGTGTSGSSGGALHTAPIISCGNHPAIQNGDVVEKDEMFLRYECNSFYTQVGPESVMCFSDGTWSELPSCRSDFCSVDTSLYPDLVPDGVKYIKNGEVVTLPCADLWWTNHYSVVHCTNGSAKLSRCCTWITIKSKLCRY